MKRPWGNINLSLSSRVHDGSPVTFGTRVSLVVGHWCLDLVTMRTIMTLDQHDNARQQLHCRTESVKASSIKHIIEFVNVVM